MKNFIKMGVTFIAISLFLSAFIFLISFIFSFIYSKDGSEKVFFSLFSSTFLLAILIIFLKKYFIKKSPIFKQKDTILWTILTWVLVILIGIFPFFILGKEINFFTALFESVSSWTTSGMNLIGISQKISPSILFYKAFIIWMGGLGIIIFMAIVIPSISKGLSGILMTEQKTLGLSNITNKVSSIVKLFAALYVALTVLCFILLIAFKMPIFDAIIHSFSAISTGGISTFDSGITNTGNFTFEIIIALFCILGALNFLALVGIKKNGLKSFFNFPEIRGFFYILILASLIIFAYLSLSGFYDKPLIALHHSFIEVTAFMTTAGYIGVNYADWPAFTKIILFCLLFVGGCSNSTAGSLKVIRVMTFFSIVKRDIIKKLHPKSVIPLKVSNRILQTETVSDITVFIFVFIFTFTIGTVLLSFEGLDFSTTVSASIACLANAGIGFGDMSNGANLTAFSNYGQSIMCILMFLGRLELFTVILLLYPSFWKSKK